MFKFIKKGESIDLVSNEITFKNISISVQSEKNEVYTLPILKVEDSIIYGEDKNAHATVKIMEKDGILTLSAEGGLVCNNPENQADKPVQTNLSAFGAFSFTFSEIEGLTTYTASNLKVFWTVVDRLGSNDIKEVANDTQALLFENKNSFGLLFATCDKKYKSLFEGSKKGLSARLLSYTNDISTFNSVLFFFAMGDNPYALPSKITEYGLEFLGKKAAPASKKRYPEIFEYLGWCSWDAFPLCVSHEGIIEKCEEFKQKNIPVRWGIIDDMWATLDEENTRENMHDRKLVDFKADPKQFPNGLKACISEVKEKYGLKIGVWHPITGYWYGFDLEGDTAKKHSKSITKNNYGKYLLKPTAEDFFTYHNDLYTYLKNSGAEFVKVDNQSSIFMHYRNMGAVGEVADNIHTGIEGAVGLNFDSAMINCMGCATENIWNRPNSLINRCSGDFLPENRKWFINHILQCTFTCYFYSGLFKGDFDMFWTDDGQAVKNCLLRAISGGPVYVSDKVGRSVAERLLPLVLADGRLLRCNNSAVPTADCLTVDPRTAKKAYKVFNTTNNGFVVAAFNLDNDENSVDGYISPFELQDAIADKYVAYNFFDSEVTLLSKGKALEFTLKDYDDYKFYNFIPVENGFAPIGLIEKYVTSATYEKFGKNKYTVLNGGLFAFYSEKKPKSVLVDGEQVSITTKNNYYLVDLGKINTSHIIEFDF